MASQTTSGTRPLLTIPATAAAGALVFTQPPQTAAASFYKIAPSQPITFGWNFTSVLATPTSLTVSAVCNANGNTYPVGPTDGVIPGTATEVVWDVYSYHQTTPFSQETYTLMIWDDRGKDAARRGGYLEPNTNLRFALYTPQPYTSIADGKFACDDNKEHYDSDTLFFAGWRCPSCNSAITAVRANPALVALVATFAIMFISGWRLLRNH